MLSIGPDSCSDVVPLCAVACNGPTDNTAPANTIIILVSCAPKAQHPLSHFINLASAKHIVFLIKVCRCLLSFWVFPQLKVGEYTMVYEAPAQVILYFKADCTVTDEFLF
jgi:hypothetical protein